MNIWIYYRAEYENEEVMEIITASSHEEAIQEAFTYEEEHGTLFNVYLLDEDYNELETVF